MQCQQNSPGVKNWDVFVCVLYVVHDVDGKQGNISRLKRWLNSIDAQNNCVNNNLMRQREALISEAKKPTIS